MFIKLIGEDKSPMIVKVEDIHMVHGFCYGVYTVIEFIDGRKFKVSNSVDDIYEMIKDYNK